MVYQKSVRVQINSYGRSVTVPSCLSRPVSSFEDFRCLNSYPLDQVGSGKFFRGKIYDWLKRGILLMWINFLHSRLEALRGASCAKTHFIHCLGSSRQAKFWSNATLLQPRVCFLNEIVNRERSESCYITKFSVTWRNRILDFHFLKNKLKILSRLQDKFINLLEMYLFYRLFIRLG